MDGFERPIIDNSAKGGGARGKFVSGAKVLAKCLAAKKSLTRDQKDRLETGGEAVVNKD